MGTAPIKSSQRTPVVIMGAGPYGLSLAAHLAAAGVPHRIFGVPMSSWSTQMPAGMHLKSDGFASSLSSPGTPFTLEDYCREQALPYHPTDLPVPVETFIAYGLAFARRFVPHLEPATVVSLARRGDAFTVALSTGETLHSDRVVLALGLSHFAHLPAPFSAFGPDRVSHTTDHHSFARFRGQRVAVVGRGASSLNAAVLLDEAGALPTLITRRAAIHIPGSIGAAAPRSLFQRLRHPRSPLGTSLRSWVTSTFPGSLQLLPDAARRLLLYKHLGPAGGASLAGRIEGRIPLRTRRAIGQMASTPTGLSLSLIDLDSPDAPPEILLCDHLIAGTGFQIDIDRIAFVDAELRAQIRLLASGAPRLSRHFESSVAGLYFIGPAAAGSFGSLLRFAAGAGFAARRLTRRLRREVD